MFYGIGQAFNNPTAGAWDSTGGATHIAAHAVAGGVISDLQGGNFGHGFFSAGVSKYAGGKFLPSGGDLSAGEIAYGTVMSGIIGGTASKISGGKFANGARTAAFQYLFNQAGKSIGRMAKARELQRRCESNPNCGIRIGLSGSVTHPLYSLAASGTNAIQGDAITPTGLSASIYQNSASTEGGAQAGFDYSSGLGAKMVGSLDVLTVGANPDAELTLVIGLGVRLYWENRQFVGFGFAAGAGASWMTKPVPVNIEVGTTPLALGATWGG